MVKSKVNLIDKRFKYVICNYCCYGLLIVIASMMILDVIHFRAHPPHMAPFQNLPTDMPPPPMSMPPPIPMPSPPVPMPMTMDQRRSGQTEIISIQFSQPPKKNFTSFSIKNELISFLITGELPKNETFVINQAFGAPSSKPTKPIVEDRLQNLLAKFQVLDNQPAAQPTPKVIEGAKVEKLSSKNTLLQDIMKINKKDQKLARSPPRNLRHADRDENDEFFRPRFDEKKHDDKHREKHEEKHKNKEHHRKDKHHEKDREGHRRKHEEMTNGPQDHLYDVKKEQMCFAHIMAIFMIFDTVVIGIFIYRLIGFSDLLKLKEQIAPAEKKQKKTKKTKKSRRVEENKEDIESNIKNEEPTIQEESVNLSISSEDSEGSLVRKDEVVPEQIPQAQPVHIAPQNFTSAPQLIRIGDKTYIAVKATDIQNFNQCPQNFITFERGHNSYMF